MHISQLCKILPAAYHHRKPGVTSKIEEFPCLQRLHIVHVPYPDTVSTHSLVMRTGNDRPGEAKTLYSLNIALSNNESEPLSSNPPPL
jgi:hypothetical protein